MRFRSCSARHLGPDLLDHGRVVAYSASDEVYGFLPHAHPAVHDGPWLACRSR